MEKNTLQEVVKSLEKSLEAIQKSNWADERNDTRIRSRYAEYLVALKFADMGFDVHVKSGIRGPDLILNGKTRIEVKSGVYNERGGGFSFGRGAQITNEQFDYCVCVAFPEDGGPEIKEILVFKINELSEIARPRGKNIVRYVSTNPCILIRNYTEEEYLKNAYGKPMDPSDIYKIELDIIRHPKNYQYRWDKIPKNNDLG